MHDSFYLATLIEFTVWNNGLEETIKKFNGFDNLPAYLYDELKKDSSEITFQGEKWCIVEISRDLCQHGKGMRVKIRLEKNFKVKNSN